MLELTPEKLQVVRGEPFETYNEKRSTTVEVQNLTGGIAASLLRTVGRAPELEVLKKRCGFSPIPVFWNERRVECLHLLPPAEYVLKIGDPPALKGLGWPAASVGAKGDCDAYVGVCPGMPASLIVLVHGLSFVVPEPGLPDAFCAVVPGELFRKDLSNSGIVKDKVFEKAQQSLKKVCHDFMIRMSERTGTAFARASHSNRAFIEERSRPGSPWEMGHTERRSGYLPQPRS